jgi:hypothetical protein
MPEFVSCDLRRFSLIPSMDLGARVSLIIYLHSWSESMALPPSIWQISLGFPKSLVFRVHPKDGKSLDLGKPYVGILFLLLS